jgi:hypothetical protein
MIVNVAAPVAAPADSTRQRRTLVATTVLQRLQLPSQWEPE